jgi:pimeloyl-ACP methyl ester carboxylesterase
VTYDHAHNCYLHYAIPGAPTILAIPGFTWFARDQWLRSFPRHSGILALCRDRGYNAIFPRSWSTNWSERDDERIVECAEYYLDQWQVGRMSLWAHSDGVRAALAADKLANLDGELEPLFASLVMVGGVAKIGLLGASGGPIWFTVGERGPWSVQQSQVWFSDVCERTGRLHKATVEGASHAWPVAANERFAEWSLGRE